MDDSKRLEIEERLRAQIEAYHAVALAHAAVKLGLPETMGAESWVAARLAKELGVSAPHLERMLQGLAALDLVEPRKNATFALTKAGRALALGSGSNLREKLLVVVEQYWQPWANLAACVETGTPSFETVFGMPVGDWRRGRAEHGEAFDAYLARESFVSAGPIVEALRLTGTETIADIGGGHGGVLGAVLKAAPSTRGVLFDRAHTLDGARSYLGALGVADRVTFVAGDLFAEIPVEADIYVLKGVLQQHGDAAARTILENCRDAMKPGARLMVVERLMPENAGDDPAAVMLDLHMMAITGGKVRTSPEMEALIAEAGLTVAELSKTYEGLAFIACAIKATTP